MKTSGIAFFVCLFAFVTEKAFFFTSYILPTSRETTASEWGIHSPTRATSPTLRPLSPLSTARPLLQTLVVVVATPVSTWYESTSMPGARGSTAFINAGGLLEGGPCACTKAEHARRENKVGVWVSYTPYDPVRSVLCVF